MKVNIAKLSNGCSALGYALNSDGELVPVQQAPYLDLGRVVHRTDPNNGYQIAAGESAVVPILDNVDWVRNMVIFFRGTPGLTAQIIIASVDPWEPAINSDEAVIYDTTAQAAVCDDAWHCYTITAPIAVLGKKGFITVKNTHSTTPLDADIRVQLLGGG